MKICIMVNFLLGQWGMTARPEISEVYAEVFPKLGHQSTWIVWSGGEFVRRQINPSTSVFGVPRPEHRLMAWRMLQHLVAMCRKARILNDLASEKACDLVVVEDDVLGGLAALAVGRCRKFPVVFHHASPDAEIMLLKSSLGLYPSPRLYRLLATVWLWFTRCVMRMCDRVIAQSEALRTALISQGFDTHKVVAIPNGARTDHCPSVATRQDIAAEYGLAGHPVVLYLGTLDMLRRLAVLIRAFALVVNEAPRARLLIVGEGDDRPNLEALASELGIGEQVMFVGWVPYVEVSQYLAAADVGVCPIPPEKIYKVSSPLKLYEYLAAGRPVVANREIPEHERVLRESGGGILVSYDPQAVACGILDLVQSKAKRDAMGRNGRDWVLKNASYEVIARRVEKVLLEVMAGRDARLTRTTRRKQGHGSQ